MPGEILEELYLAPREISISEFAEATGVTRKHMSGIINGHVTLTAEMAARIATALGTTADYWLNVQNAVDLYDAEERLAVSENPPRLMEAFAAEIDAGSAFPPLEAPTPEIADSGTVRLGNGHITTGFALWRQSKPEHRNPYRDDAARRRQDHHRPPAARLVA